MDISKLKGIGVDHTKYHTGVIIDTEEQGDSKYITVRFDIGNKISKFAYPDAFYSYLTAIQYEEEIKDDIREKNKQKQIAAELDRKKVEDRLRANHEREKELRTKSKKHNSSNVSKKKPFDPSQIKRLNAISEGDSFDRIMDVLNQCFGKSNKSGQKCYVNVGNNYHMWCPKIAELENGRYHAANKEYGFINVIVDDGDIILEGNENPNLIETEYGTYYDKRAVFTKTGNERYIFRGVYENGGYDKERKSRIHKRVAKVLDLTYWYCEACKENGYGTN